MISKSFHVQAVVTHQNTLWQMVKVMVQSKKRVSLIIHSTLAMPNSRTINWVCLWKRNIQKGHHFFLLKIASCVKTKGLAISFCGEAE